MISISAGILAISAFLPQAVLVVNATPGVRVEIVEQTVDGRFIPASTFVQSYTASSKPRKIYVRTSDTTKALCAQTEVSSPGPNTLSVVYRSCALLQRKAN